MVEMTVSFLIGLICGILPFLVIFLWNQDQINTALSKFHDELKKHQEEMGKFLKSVI